MTNISRKVKAKGQHEAINKLRRQLPHTQILKVRTARKITRGIYVVQGAVMPRRKSSKLERIAVWRKRAGVK